MHFALHKDSKKKNNNIFFNIVICNTVTHYVMKNKHVSIRMPLSLYQKYVDKAVEKSSKEKKLFSVSDLIRETLEKEL